MPFRLPSGPDLRSRLQKDAVSFDLSLTWTPPPRVFLLPEDETITDPAEIFWLFIRRVHGCVHKVTC